VPNHAFVFFDEHGVPTARVQPCFNSHTILWEPSSHPELLRNDEPPLMTTEERATLAAILDRHGLAAWAFDPEGRQSTQVRAYDRAVYGSDRLTERGLARKAEQLALPPPVDRDVPPKRLTAKDRARLRAWFDDQLETTDQGGGWKGRGYECPSGRVDWAYPDEGHWGKVFAQCEVPVRQLEPCLRAFVKGPDVTCREGLPAACTGMAECVPGLRRHVPLEPGSAAQ
jgi:hypothetical protein